MKQKQGHKESFQYFWRALRDSIGTGKIRVADVIDFKKDVFICFMKNSETQRKLIYSKISSSETLSQAFISE